VLTILITSVCAKCDSGCTLDCFPHTVRRLVAFYVNEDNGVLPHSAFRGQTPTRCRDSKPWHRLIRAIV
jgi:hypothetical protein